MRAFSFLASVPLSRAIFASLIFSMRALPCGVLLKSSISLANLSRLAYNSLMETNMGGSTPLSMMACNSKIRALARSIAALTFLPFDTTDCKLVRLAASNFSFCWFNMSSGNSCPQYGHLSSENTRAMIESRSRSNSSLFADNASSSFLVSSISSLLFSIFFLSLSYSVFARALAYSWPSIF